MSEADEQNDLSLLKRRRGTLRNVFTRLYNTLAEILKGKPGDIDINLLKSKFATLKEKNDGLRIMDEKILDTYFSMNISEDDINKDVEECDDYNCKFGYIQSKIDKIAISDSCSEDSKSVRVENQSNGMRLTKISPVMFNGELLKWLPFWNQFQRIDQDERLSDADKFHYLLQYMEPRSRAHQVVSSYPASEGNYVKAVNSLKSRFGRNDLLVEVYMRELLKLVMGMKKRSLAEMYDKLESQLQALETLGISSDTYSAMLFPLVESCLPEDLLRVWQRTYNASNLDVSVANTSSHPSLTERLKSLMHFLKVEVEGEERIALAVGGFQHTREEKFKCRERVMLDIESTPSANDLSNMQVKIRPSNVKVLRCIFCGSGHSNEICMEAKKLTLEQRMDALRKIGCCFICMKPGHRAKNCRVGVKCSMCKSRHVDLLCPKLVIVSKNQGKLIKSGEQSLFNHTPCLVFLQTLSVQIRSEGEDVRGRALIDTGSERSYITKDVAEKMGYVPVGEEQLVHCLFGGEQSAPVSHKVYEAHLGNVDLSYLCRFKALDQPIITQRVSCVHDGPWMREVKQLGIELLDTVEGPIDILIGADIAGKIITGERHVLSSGLIVIKTLIRMDHNWEGDGESF